MNDRIPRTADGHIIYPYMPVFLCSPYSIEKSIPLTVYSVEGNDGFSEKNDYTCVICENRHYDCNRDYWATGNYEHVSQLYANEDECLRAANEINKHDQNCVDGTEDPY